MDIWDVVALAMLLDNFFPGYGFFKGFLVGTVRDYNASFGAPHVHGWKCLKSFLASHVPKLCLINFAFDDIVKNFHGLVSIYGGRGLFECLVDDTVQNWRFSDIGVPNDADFDGFGVDHIYLYFEIKFIF